MGWLWSVPAGGADAVTRWSSRSSSSMVLLARPNPSLPMVLAAAPATLFPGTQLGTPVLCPSTK
eukprot:3943946-Prorocentrum_lima.AAC.1